MQYRSRDYVEMRNLLEIERYNYFYFFKINNILWNFLRNQNVIKPNLIIYVD